MDASPRGPEGPLVQFRRALDAAIQNRSAEAAAALAERALSLPLTAEDNVRLGGLLFALGQPQRATEAFGRAVELAPGDARHFLNLGLGLARCGRLGQAEAMLRHAARLDPGDPHAQLQLAELLVRRQMFAEAEQRLRELIRQAPEASVPYQKLGNLLLAQGRIEEIVALMETAVASAPDQADSHQQLSVAYELVGRLPEALASARRALALKPPVKLDMTVAGFASLVGLTAQLEERRQVVAMMEALTDPGLADPPPEEEDLAALRRLAFLMPYFGIEDNRRLAVLRRLGTALAQRTPALEAGRCAPAALADGRLRVGYLSSNLGDHPIGHLLAGFFEAHKPLPADLVFYSLNPRRRDASAYPARLRAAASRVWELSGAGEAAAVAAIRSDGPHILIDLDGYLGGGRPELLIHRLAPVQIHWLQHLAGMPAPFVDYTIVDKVLTPDTEVGPLNGPLIRLPAAFQCGDRVPLDPGVPTRVSVGLPSTGVVFCAFNNCLKIDAEAFDAWTQVLKAVEASVLWLSDAHPAARLSLMDAAEERGLDRARLVFAPRVAGKAEHLRRHRAADLFLDTFAFSAATSALDALWAGLPVLTRRAGQAHGRLSESQLRAVGLGELVAQDTADFVRMAIELARDAIRRRSLSDRLSEAVWTAPLFDFEAMAGQFAGLYAHVWDRRQSGLAPQSFDVMSDGRCAPIG